MSAAKRLLVISPFCPLPTDSGGKSRLFFTLKNLSQNFQIKLFSFFRHQEEKILSDKFFLENKISNLYIFQKSNSLFSFLTSGIPYWFSPWYSPVLINNLRQDKSPKVLIETTQLLYLVDHISESSKKIFTAYDVSTVSFWRRLLQAPWFKKPLHLARLAEIYLYERKYLPKFDLVVAVTQNDAKILRKHFNCHNVIVIPNGIEKINFLSKRPDSVLNFGYIGSPVHSPNTAAIDFIINKVIPKLENKNIRYHFYLAGSGHISYKNPNVTVLGQISDPKSFYQKIDFLLAPIFSGSGSRVKIIESLSYGTPVLTTPVGAEGIELHNRLLQISEPNKIIDHLLKIKADKQIVLQNESLKTQLKNLLWSKLIKLLCDQIDAL